ncbi:Gfo/Idh/MocA family oxidoreductase [Streptomyces sp. NPDC091215]|uniref:Gfo/Idh/MocA family protein n=1 Tax=Streptomyces sp. NPDC091215 TaxID=3155192 RepID=UPI003432DCD3
MSVLGVGFIGAGPVTQAIHLPHLAGLSDRLRTVHVMDVDPGTAEAVAARTGARASTSVAELLADPRVDVVAVCSPHSFHAEQAEACVRAGKKAILVEKPFATTVGDAERIAHVSAEAGVPVVVGAMHTYDPAYLAAAHHWNDLPATARHIRSVIQLPPNSRYETLATQLHGTPPPPPTADLTSPDGRTALMSGLILGLAIHNLPLVRRFLPEVEAVDHAILLDPAGYSVTLHGPDGRTAELVGHIGHSWRPEWTFEAWGADTSLHLDFTPSYVRAGSAEATVRTPEGTRSFGPFPHNGYAAEWLHLADLANGVTDPLHSPKDLVEDLAYAIRLADLAGRFLSREGARA